MQRRTNILIKNARRLQTQDRPDALPSSKYAVAHSRVNGCWRRLCRGQQLLQRGIHRKAILFKKFRKFHQVRKYRVTLVCAPWHRLLLKSCSSRRVVTTPSPTLDQRAAQASCHPPSSTKSLRGLPLLPVASGTRAKVLRLLQTISWRRPAKAVDFPACAPLLQDAPENAQNPAFWRVPLFS